MDRRVDKNQQIYKEVNEMIRAKKANKANGSFETTSSTLKSINPSLFGNNKTNEEAKEVKKESLKEKLKLQFNSRTIYAALAIAGLLIVFVLIWLITK